MEKKNKLLIGILITTMLLLAGCSTDIEGQTSGFLGGGSSSTTTNKGNGVDLTFAENNPPSSMIKGQPVTFAFIFTNHQEHEITNLKLKTKNFDTGYVSGLASDYSIKTIPRASDKTGAGVYAGQIVEGVKIDKFEGNYKFNPVFDYCYTQKSTYLEQICVPSTRNQCDEKIESSTNQNGPLSVTIERITAIDNKIRIDFVIKNNGKGQVVNECFKTDDYANKYNLAVTLGTAKGDCEAVSGQTIINGQSNFYCTFPRQGDESYASQVVVELDSLYQQQTKLSIAVEDLNQGYD